MLNQRLLKNLDFVLIGVTALLVLISLVVIGSATHVNNPSEDRYWFVQRQGTFAVLNVLLIFIMLHFDYKNLEKFAGVLYVVNLVMLLAVMFVGQSALGAQRWIQIGPINLQPSEFSKLIMIIGLAQVLDKRTGQLQSLRDLIPIFLYVGIPFFLVLKQPDLGTSLVFLAILSGMIFIAGISNRHLMMIFGAAVAIMPVFWHFLKDYQKKRLTVFIDPNIDPLGSGYHIIQSKIAIGSGMLFGKGLFAGTQSQLNFLPENHTDFIFAVIGEELGFVGATLILLLYLVLLYRCIKVAGAARDNFGSLLATGITSMLAFHLLVNVGMTAGIMPVTGIPLPLMSYGVSSLTTNLVSIGILLNIYMRRQKILF
ncbi:MAG TPA: rod shape-determining protein RodA [Patescibacteria group bacterium]|nr:rod shape-determining protein RodA [Patescibacteria group bacterium]